METSRRFFDECNSKKCYEICIKKSSNTGVMGLCSVPKLAGGMKIHTMVLNGFTCRAPRLVNSSSQETRKSHLPVTAYVLGLKSLLNN